MTDKKTQRDYLGQPTKCTPETTEKVADLIRAGNYVTVACRVARISRDAHYDWIEKANEAKAKQANGGRITANQKAYIHYADAIAAAEAEGEAVLTAEVHRAGTPHKVQVTKVTTRPVRVNGAVLLDPSTNRPIMETTTTTEEREEVDWRAAMAILRARFRDRWGDTLGVEHSGEVGGPAPIVVQPSDKAAYAELLAAWEESGLDPSLLLGPGHENGGTR